MEIEREGLVEAEAQIRDGRQNRPRYRSGVEELVDAGGSLRGSRVGGR